MSSTQQKKLADTAIMVSLILMALKLLGFVREMIIAAYFGAGWQMDAYYAANSLTGALFTSVGTAVMTAFIPIYTRIKKRDESAAQAFASNSVNVTTLGSLPVVIVGMLLAPWLMRIFGGFEEAAMQTSIKYARIMFITFLFSANVSVYTGVLQANQRFFLSSLSALPVSVCSILAAVLFSARYGVDALAYATVAAFIMRFFMFSISARRLAPIRRSVNFTDANIKSMLLLLGPMILTVALSEVNSLVDKSLASGLGAGTISAMKYAQNLLGFASMIIVSALTSVSFPRFSALSQAQDYDGLREMLNRTACMLIFLLAPIIFGGIIFSGEIITIVYRRGAFLASDVPITATALAFYLPTVANYAIIDIFNRVTFSLEDTKRPMINSVLMVVINIILNLIFVNFWGMRGLIIATVIATGVGACLSVLLVKKKLGHIGLEKMLREIILIIICAAAACAGAYIVARSFTEIFANTFKYAVYIRFVLAVITAALIYMGLSWVLKVPSFGGIIKYIRAKLNR